MTAPTRVHPPTLLLATLGVQGALSFLPDPLPAVPWALRGLGALAILLGVALNVASSKSFERSATPIRPLESPRALVTEGAFRLSRNPMYLGFVLIAAGLGLLVANLWALLGVVPLFVALRRLVLREERLMAATFGDAFDAYRRSVRRWV